MRRLLPVMLLLTALGTRAQAGGAPVSIDVKDGDVTDVLRVFAEIGDVNLVVDPAVGGKTITLRLVDVPWDQALDLVLSVQGLAAVHEGNVLRVAPSSKLVAEANQRVQLREAREQAGELRTIAVPLSNADATQAEAIVRKSLTARGSTAVDRRTNTLFITDVFPGAGESGGMLEHVPSSPGASDDARSVTSVGFDVRLFEISGALPAGLSAAAIAALPGTRLLDSARVVLGVEQHADVVLGGSSGDPSARIMVSPRLDGLRTVLALRASQVVDGMEGALLTRSVATGREEAVTLRAPGRLPPLTSLVLAFVPA